MENDIPKKKKRQPSRYNLFVGKYILEHKSEGLKPRDALRKASQAWKEFKEQQKTVSE